MSITARRIIRTKKSPAAIIVGRSYYFGDIDALIAFAKARKRVFAFVDSNGNEGTIRSGRFMRKVDSHVRNTLSVGAAIQIPIDFEAVQEVGDSFAAICEPAVST